MTSKPARTAIHRKEFDPGSRGPLHGVRVVDLARLVAGNMLTLQLADFGAEVIKVEPPTGDTLRSWRIEGVETAWKVYCRNKKSIGLDLRRPEAQAAVRKLVEGAQVFVESFRPGVVEEMGLGPEALFAANPKLVIVRISGWGQTGPYRHKPGFGTLIEGYSGYASQNGFADREPVLPPIYLGDMTGGLYGAIATLVALRNVESGDGRGQVIDLSLFEPMFSILGPQAANFRLTGKVKQRTGSRSTNSAPRNAYRTSDGKWVCLSASTQGMTEKVFRSIGRPDLISHKRFRTNADRVKHVEELDPIVAEFVARRTQAENLAYFDEAGVTIGPIYDISELMADPYIVEREALVELPDPEMGLLPMHNVVPRLSRTPGALRRPAPFLGEHNAEILEPALGRDEFNRLDAAGIIIAGKPDKAGRKPA